MVSFFYSSPYMSLALFRLYSVTKKNYKLKSYKEGILRGMRSLWRLTNMFPVLCVVTVSGMDI